MNAMHLLPHFIVNTQDTYYSPNPKFDPYKINETEFSSEMRHLEYCVEFKNNTFFIEWTTLFLADVEGFVKEICRWLHKWEQIFPLDPFNMDISMCWGHTGKIKRVLFSSDNKPFSFSDDTDRATKCKTNYTMTIEDIDLTASIWAQASSEERREMVKALLAEGFPIERIIHLSKLTETEVLAIKASLEH